MFCQEDCSIGKITDKIKTEKCIKDLRKVAKKFGTALDACVLVDDDNDKSAEGCNFIKAAEFIPTNESDNEILNIIEAIKGFVGA